MRSFVLFVLLIINYNVSLSQYIFKKLFSIPYGQKENQICIRKESDGVYGPGSFLSLNKIFYILDSENDRLKIFSELGSLQKSIIIPKFSENFVVDKNFAYILSEGSFLTTLDIIKSEIIACQRIKTSYSGVADIKYKEGLLELKNCKDEYEVYIIDGSNKSTFKKSISNNVAKFKTVKINSSEAVLNKIGEDDRVIFSFSIREKSAKLASITLINTDNYGNYYFNEELFITEIPCSIQRYILKYNRSGEFITKIKLPNIYYSRIEHDIWISEEGEIFQLISNKDSLEIVKWENDPKGINKEEFTYPDEYKDSFHYNQNILEIPNNSLNINPASDPIKITVNRDESVQIADTYEKFIWACSSINISNGIITAPDGKQIWTPDWITSSGQYNKMPYQWGGFSTLQSFTSGIATGKYAGDRFTSKSSGSNYAVGVDCSGFVSRCWKLSNHYNTSMMPSITTKHNSWTDLKKGDAILYPGSHVRMSIENNPNGTVSVIESSGKDWRVSYWSYNFNELASYYPCRYNGMQESATGISQQSVEDNSAKLFSFPNPFNNSIRIIFGSFKASNVNLKIVDLLGRNIKNFSSNNNNNGIYEFFWDGKDNYGFEVASGPYYCILLYKSIDKKDLILTNKLFLLK
jgi:cell wall-associated NlpC family hydrolase